MGYTQMKDNGAGGEMKKRTAKKVRRNVKPTSLEFFWGFLFFEEVECS